MREAMLNPVTGQMEYTQAPASNAVQPLINYSTEEQDTGQLWIDGRKIYQRTWTVSLNHTYSAGVWRTILSLPADLSIQRLMSSDVNVDSAATAIYSFYSSRVAGTNFDVYTVAASSDSTYVTHITLRYTKNE